MNGLSLLGLILGGLIGWWAAWSLIYGGTRRKYPPTPVARKLDRWDGNR